MNGRGGRQVLVLLAALFGAPATAQTELIEAEELAPPSGSVATMRFTTLPAEETGIAADNPYDDPRMWGDRFEAFAYGAIGTGVAIGDYDQDGSADVFLVSKTGANRLYRNRGGWRFEEVTATAGVAGPADAWQQGASFADVNNDGWLDLYVCRWAAPNLLYLNQGDGTFREQARAAGVDLADASGMGAFADYDRDGWLDLYVATNLLDHARRPDGEPGRLYRNRGDGTFVEVTAAAGLGGAAQTHAAIWWDDNGDQWPDLYVTNDFGWPDQLWRNRGDGRFRDVIGLVVPYLPRFAMGADLGDVNNDGHIDLLVADMLPTMRERDQRSMIDARAHQVDPTDPAMTPQYMRNMLYLNTGTGRMLEAGILAGLAATDWTWSVRFADFDNDGWLDLHVTNGMVRRFFDVDLRQAVANLPPAERRQRIRASPRLDEANLAFRNRGDLRFEPVGRDWGLDHVGVSFGAALGDLDGDGDLDLVFANYDGPPTVCRNDSPSGQRLVVALRGTQSNRWGVGATVAVETASGRQVRTLALARGYLSSSEPVVHFGLGDDDRVRRLVVRWPSGLEQAFTDLPAGRRYRVTEPTPAVREPPRPPGRQDAQVQFVEVGAYTQLNLRAGEAAVNEFAAQPLLSWRQNVLGPGVAVADVNGDGADDVVLGGGTGSPAQLALATGDARFTAAALPVAPERMVVADAAPLVLELNGDGRPDLLIPRGGVARPAGDAAYMPHVLWNRGGGAFVAAEPGSHPSYGHSAGAAVAADFDRDGWLDVFIGGRTIPGQYPQAEPSVLWRNRGGTLAEATALAPGLAAVGATTAALWSDVDGDGWLDLLVAPTWGQVQCWRNQEGRGFAAAAAEAGFAAAGRGWWSSLAAGDFNGDGRMDYAVGNVGLNTPFPAAPTRPFALWRVSAPGGNRDWLVEATGEQGRWWPWRGRATWGRAMPALLRRFPTVEQFAAAEVEDLFPADVLAAAPRVEVDQLHSGVFLSQPDGTRTFVPLPRLAQIAPIFGLAAADFTGDGATDLYVVHNSRAPAPEFGRLEGGLSQLLAGDGRGGFTPVPHRESNLLVPGDAKAVAVFDPDQDGRPDLLVTRRDAPALVYANTGRHDAHWLRVELHAGDRNPTAAGAGVTAISGTGRRQRAEVALGGGYLSQSSGSLFFGFAADDPVRRLEVRWPDGRSTTTTVPPDRPVVRLAAPAAGAGE